MGLAFVTGATGFVGHNLTVELSKRGWDATALVRNTTSPQALQIAKLPGVTLAQGDITVTNHVCAAIPKNTDVVFHCAADTSQWRGHARRQTLVNVDGTRNVIHATYEGRAQVLVHLSTASVYGHQPQQPYDETALQRGQGAVSNYVRTKYAAERSVRRAVKRGLDAVIVNPGHIMGQFDTSGWAQLIQKIDQEALPGQLPGGGCFAHVDNVVRATIRAAEVGKRGENYLLGGPYAAFAEVIELIAKQLGRSPPEKMVPPWLLSLHGRWNNFVSGLTKKQPDGLTREAAWLVSHNDHFSSEKAKQQLGYSETSLYHTIQQAVEWQLRQGLVTGAGDTAMVEQSQTPKPQPNPAETQGAGFIRKGA